ncbi:hypothetical protein FQA39_LY09760 [Lamprigera yunnana]|nr:hypothetical protein FQA39_LY09760 [Lamprigera yunnana]
MEVIYLFVSVILLFVKVQSAAINNQGTILTLNDLSQSDRDYLEYLKNEAIRQKRSGDVLGTVKSKISHGLKSKLSGFASASSHGSSFLSGGSKGLHHYDTPYDDKSFNFWDLQKSIFHTLFQAAKAIKGGLLAIKGQLIKGSGYVISAKGKLISAKGQAITNLGKNIASSAILVPRPSIHHTAPSGPEEPVYAEHPISSGYDDSSGPGVEYHSHHYDSAPGAILDKYPPVLEAYKDHHPRATNQGILIIKKIPKVKVEEHKGNNGAHNLLETHKPVVESEEPLNPPFTFLPDAKSPSSFNSNQNEEFSPLLQANTLNSHEHVQETPLNYNSPSLSQYEAPSSHGYLQNLPHIYTPPSAQSDNYHKLETYEPLLLPSANRQPLIANLPNHNVPKYPTIIKGLEHFPSYPLDFHKKIDKDAQYSTLLTDILLPSSSLHETISNKSKEKLYRPLSLKSVSRLKRPTNDKIFKSVTRRLKPKDI